MNEAVSNDLSILPSDTETIAELRELYRAAEARAARMRLLSVSARDLATSDPSSLDQALEACCNRLAFFLGQRAASLNTGERASGLEVHSPGQSREVIARIELDGVASLDEIADREDRETVSMLLDLIGTTLDRIGAENERACLLDTLREREKNLEFLVDRIFTAQEEERRRVSHELHDGVAQTATALARMLEGIEVTRADEVGSDAQDDSMHPATIARGLVSELRRVIAGLRPTLLDDLGLVPALQSLSEQLSSEGFDVTVVIEADEARLPALVETALFRVAQEAVANIRKHSGGPCKVTLEARLKEGSGKRFLRIRDHGVGPSEKTRSSKPGDGNNLGVEVMKERMAAIGGNLDWRAAEPRGVLVRACLPESLEN
ncbi:MAG: histidine kinase [Pseudomonadota bacterium]